MNQAQRRELTRILADHVSELARDLRTKVLVPGNTKRRAKKLHEDEKVGEDFGVWTDLLARRAAVLWVLQSVYVRVLEDRGLLSPGRILDREAQQLFERLAPNLGETAFLRWIWRDLASGRGGLPELFAAQPAQLVEPSDRLSRRLLEIWRERDPDSGALRWSFADERFDGELMGDLYQELDPVVKKRFALCQTPDFVRAFILDRTLAPAIEAFGSATVRLLDPACGSGHFLIDALRRLVEATGAQHPDWSRLEVVEHALDRVVGIDLNDYACALARARLVMTAAELAGVDSLEAAARFYPHVYWADALEQVEREEPDTGQQLSLLETPQEPAPRASLTQPEVRAALRPVLEPGFQAVVANPPFITEKDKARKAYHRAKVGKRRRYLSAYRQYSLGSPFLERCFQLAVRAGFVGVITSNNFMKREFGKPLIEKVLASVDLTLVVDTSQAYIPWHGTPTVLLFARNRKPPREEVRAVMGKRGEVGIPEDPEKGRVWTSIVEGCGQLGFENDFVSVVVVPRQIFKEHPWSLGGGGAVDLKQRLEEAGETTLGSITTDIGRTTVCGEDPVYIMQPDAAARRGAGELVVALTMGEVVRDWAVQPSEFVIYPYVEMGGDSVGSDHDAVMSHFWPFKALLRNRTVFGKTPEERGGAWYDHLEHYRHRLLTPLSIAFAFVATHNHFVLDRGGKVFNRSAPVIKLPEDATEDDHLALLGLLNSSTACFWMKQVFHPKTHASQRHHPDPSRGVYEFTATGIQQLPLPEFGDLRLRLVQLSSLLSEAAAESTALLSRDKLDAILQDSADGQASRRALEARWRAADTLRERMVALQEEVDWVVYVGFGMADSSCLIPPERYSDLSCPRGDRPYERITPRVSTIRVRGAYLELSQAEAPPVGNLPPWAEACWKRRVEAIEASPDLQLIESPLNKRPWRDTDKNIAEPKYRKDKDTSDLREWLLEWTERWCRTRDAAFTLPQLASALQSIPIVAKALEALSGRRDFAIEVMILQLFEPQAMPAHPYHVYTDDGLQVRRTWEETWDIQRQEDAGVDVGEIPVPPVYSQGSRGKPTHFLRTAYWKLRGKLDVPKERFIAFTEVPGADGNATLYGWAGWTPLQRIRVILALDEDLEDREVPLEDRIALLDSAWRLLHDAAREDERATSSLKAELVSLVGREGPSPVLLESWRERFPPPRRARRRRRKK